MADECVGIIIIIREICKSPPLQLKALKNNNIHPSHNIHRDGICYQQL